MVPLKLLSYVRNTQAPCIVHCSAGIGRTGTVIAIEMGIQRFSEGRKVDLCKVIGFSLFFPVFLTLVKTSLKFDDRGPISPRR